MLFFTISCIGFSQIKTIDALSAVPNPFISYTNIQFKSTSNQDIQFSVKNVLGKTVFSKSIKATKGKNILPFFKGDLLSGLYIYSIQSNQKITSKRLVIR